MAEPISAINAELRLSQILGEDFLAQVPQTPAGTAAPAEPARGGEVSGSAFEDILSKSIGALEGVSRSEIHANQLIDKYLRGEAELHEVMLEQSKMSIMVNLAVTSINLAVSTFKEITQMQI
jgi:flagellar hook-basal body complex protein FliE